MSGLVPPFSRSVERARSRRVLPAALGRRVRLLSVARLAAGPWAPGLVLLLLSLLFGPLLAVVTPPMAVPDEPGHFVRSLLVGQGEILACTTEPHALATTPALAEGLLAASLVIDRSRPQGGIPALAVWRDPALAAGGRVPVPLAPAQRVSHGIAYLPQALAASAVAALTDDFAAAVIAGRMAALAVCTLVLVVALRVLPFGRWTALFLALLPMAVFLRASLSMDGIVGALVLLATALLLRWQERRASGQPWPLSGSMALLVSIMLIALTKSAYQAILILALPVLLMPGGHRRGDLVRLVLLVVAGTGTMLAWGQFVAHNCAFSHGNFAPGEFDMAAKQALLLGDPGRVAGVLWASLRGPELLNLFRQAMAVFGWLDGPMSAPFYPLAAALLLLVPLAERFLSGPPRRRGGLVLLPAAVIAFLAASAGLWLSLWLLWTPLSFGQVEGMQGRYFLPVLPWLGLALAATGRRPAGLASDRRPAGPASNRWPALWPSRRWLSTATALSPAAGLAIGGAVLLLTWSVVEQIGYQRRYAAVGPWPERAVVRDTAPLAALPAGGAVEDQFRMENTLVLHGWAPWSGVHGQRLRVLADFPIALMGALAVIRPDRDAPDGAWRGFTLGIVSPLPVPADGHLCLVAENADGRGVLLDNPAGRNRAACDPATAGLRAADDASGG